MKIVAMPSLCFKSQSCVSDKPKTLYGPFDEFVKSSDSKHSVLIDGNYHSSDIVNIPKKVIVKGNAEFGVVSFPKGLKIDGSLGNANYIAAPKAEILGSANMLVGDFKKFLHVHDDLTVRQNLIGKDVIVGRNANFWNKCKLKYIETGNNLIAENTEFDKAVIGKDSTIKGGKFKDLSIAGELFIHNVDGERITSGGDINIYGIKNLNSIAFVKNPNSENNLSFICKMPEKKIEILLGENMKKLVIWSSKEGQNILENLAFYNAKVKTNVNKRGIIDKIAEKGKAISCEEIKQLIEKGIIECKRCT